MEYKYKCALCKPAFVTNVEKIWLGHQAWHNENPTDTTIATLRAQNAELKHLLFLVTAPLEKVAGSQNIPNMTADLAAEALSLIHAALAKYGDDNATS